MKIYRTETQEDFNELLEKMKKEGNHWWPNKVIKPNDSLLWEVHEENTVIYVEEEEISYGAIPYAKAQYPNIPIEKYEASIQAAAEEELKIYCAETQEDYAELLKKLKKEGYLWCSGKDITPDDSERWKWCEQDAVIFVSNEEISYGDTGYAKALYPNTPIEKYTAKKPETTGTLEEFAPTWVDIFEKLLTESTDASDNVNNPAHYTSGGIETLDYIKAKVSDYPSYAVGNILKYVSRYEHKNGIEDLKKAQFYLNDLIKAMEKGA